MGSAAIGRPARSLVSKVAQCRKRAPGTEIRQKRRTRVTPRRNARESLIFFANIAVYDCELQRAGDRVGD